MAIDTDQLAVVTVTAEPERELVLIAPHDVAR